MNRVQHGRLVCTRAVWSLSGRLRLESSEGSLVHVSGAWLGWLEDWHCGLQCLSVASPRGLAFSLHGDLRVAGLLQGGSELQVGVFDEKADVIFYDAVLGSHSVKFTIF